MALADEQVGEPLSETAETAAAARPHVIRRLYDWVLHWAKTPYAVPALFLLAFAESSFFPIPPDILLIALALSIQKRAFRYALVCTIGSVLGGMFGYFIGYALFTPVARPLIALLSMQSEAGHAMALYNRWDFWVVGTAAFTPIPYKVFTILGGFAQINFGHFVLASVVGRAGRFFIVAALIYFFGGRIKSFIDRYFNLCCVAFAVMLVGAFYLMGQMGKFEITATPDEIEAIIARLEDPDLVIRTEAYKELSRKTQWFFEYRPEAAETERAVAVEKCRERFAEWKKSSDK